MTARRLRSQVTAVLAVAARNGFHGQHSAAGRTDSSSGQEMFCVHRHLGDGSQNAGQGCAPTPRERLTAAKKFRAREPLPLNPFILFSPGSALRMAPVKYGVRPSQ